MKFLGRTRSGAGNRENDRLIVIGLVLRYLATVDLFNEMLGKNNEADKKVDVQQRRPDPKVSQLTLYQFIQFSCKLD